MAEMHGCKMNVSLSKKQKTKKRQAPRVPCRTKERFTAQSLSRVMNKRVTTFAWGQSKKKIQGAGFEPATFSV